MRRTTSLSPSTPSSQSRISRAFLHPRSSPTSACNCFSSEMRRPRPDVSNAKSPSIGRIARGFELRIILHQRVKMPRLSQPLFVDPLAKSAARHTGLKLHPTPSSRLPRKPPRLLKPMHVVLIPLLSRPLHLIGQVMSPASCRSDAVRRNASSFTSTAPASSGA